MWTSSFHLISFVSHCLVIGAIDLTVEGCRLTDLPRDFFSVWCSDREFARCADFDSFIFSCVEDLQNILAEVVAGTGLHWSSLEQHLDISQLSEVEVSFLVKCIVLKLELCNCGFEFACLSSASSSRSSSDRSTSSPCTNTWSSSSATDLRSSITSRCSRCWRICASTSSRCSLCSRQTSNFSTA